MEIMSVQLPDFLHRGERFMLFGGSLIVSGVRCGAVSASPNAANRMEVAEDISRYVKQ